MVIATTINGCRIDEDGIPIASTPFLTGAASGAALQDSVLIPLGRTLRKPDTPAFPAPIPHSPSPQGALAPEPRRGTFVAPSAADPSHPARRDQTTFAKFLDLGRQFPSRLCQLWVWTTRTTGERHFIQISPSH